MACRSAAAYEGAAARARSTRDGVRDGAVCGPRRSTRDGEISLFCTHTKTNSGPKEPLPLKLAEDETPFSRESQPLQLAAYK